MSENTVPIRVLTVDDHALVRAGVASLIAGQSDMTLVGEASNGLEAIELFRLRRPSVTLMDLQMPVMCGIDAITAIRSEFPTARIIALTTYAGVHLAQRALKAGALAYLLKGNIHEDFLDTIRAVNAGGRRIDPEVAMSLASHSSDDALSVRETTVLELIAAGRAGKLIARDLSIAESTVNSHVKNILSKLGALDRAHAVVIGLERGIIGFWSRVGALDTAARSPQASAMRAH
ncbi:MAG TPA: response regulator transcription factor [Burkholderiaceae bacterium]|nr:response regulator transcription factor [Burkholderiaceae bacterium]